MNIPGRRRAIPFAALATLVAVTVTACGSDTTASAPTSPSPLPTFPATPSGSSLGPTVLPPPVPATRPSGPSEPSPTGGSSTASGCVGTVVAAMSVREKAAQLITAGIRSTGMSSSERAALREQKPGGVLLVGASGRASDVRDVIASAVATIGSVRGARGLVMADQEGGKVQRLKGAGFDEIPSATVQSGWSASQLTGRATTWGRQLETAGVHVDLAPVADVVPTDVGDGNEPIGALDRDYGSDPATVGGHVAAFVRGMRAAGIATSVKHFPGLGRVRGNTDFKSGVVDQATVRKDPLLAPFVAGVAAGADMVMISTVTYQNIDPKNRAVFSSVVIQDMLRGDLKFDGVVIADDLGAAAEVASVPPGERAVRFVAAGGDIVITADASLVRTMVDALVSRAQQDKAFGSALDEHVRRVLALKQRQGLVSCR